MARAAHLLPLLSGGRRDILIIHSLSTSPPIRIYHTPSKPSVPGHYITARQPQPSVALCIPQAGLDIGNVLSLPQVPGAAPYILGARRTALELVSTATAIRQTL